MAEHPIYAMAFAKVYPLYFAKAQRNGHTFDREHWTKLPAEIRELLAAAKRE